MNPFEKVTALLDRMEYLVNEEQFDIDNEECYTLNSNIINEFKKLELIWIDNPEFTDAKERFEKLWNNYEPIEEDEKSARDMMFPEEKDDNIL